MDKFEQFERLATLREERMPIGETKRCTMPRAEIRIQVRIKTEWQHTSGCFNSSTFNQNSPIMKRRILQKDTIEQLSAELSIKRYCVLHDLLESHLALKHDERPELCFREFGAAERNIF